MSLDIQDKGIENVQELLGEDGKLKEPYLSMAYMMMAISMGKVTAENYPKCHARMLIVTGANGIVLEDWKRIIGLAINDSYVSDEVWMRRQYWRDVHDAYHRAGIDVEEITYDTPEEAVYVSENEFDKITIKALRKHSEKIRVGENGPSGNIKFHRFFSDDNDDDRIWVMEQNKRFRIPTEEDILEYNL